MMKIIAAAAFVAAPWQPTQAQAIVGSIPEEFRGDWCQENTKDNIFKPGGCKLKAGSLSIDRMTLDTGRLSCGFDSGTASDGTLQMRMLCTDSRQNTPARTSEQNDSAVIVQGSEFLLEPQTRTPKDPAPSGLNSRNRRQARSATETKAGAHDWSNRIQ